MLDALHLYRDECPVNTVLGFCVDSRLHNFSWLDDCDYVQADLGAHKIPGVQMLENPTMQVAQLLPDSARSYVTVHTNKGAERVAVRCIYNGSDLLVTHTFSGFPGVDYAQTVVELHRAITGCGVGLDCYKHEAEESLGSIVAVRYVPITATYMETLSAMSDACAAGQASTINKKHDGVPMWLYSSRYTPASLLKQIKSRDSVQHRYVGTVADYPDASLQSCWCLALERVDGPDRCDYIAVDAFTEGDAEDDYRTRLAKLQRFVGAYSVPGGPHSLHLNLKVTDAALISGHSSGTGDSLVSAMREMPAGTDGFVVYVGCDRPLKIKPPMSITVDLEYSVHRGVGEWRLPRELPCKPQEPDYEMIAACTDGIAVVEVRLCDGSIVRFRPDRTRGNSAHVVERVIRAYLKDLKHSDESVWRGASVRLPILLNRMFKRFVHRKCLYRGAHVIDFGSGHGGDISIWRDMGYRVLCVELNTERYNVLSEKLRKEQNVTAVQGDMRDVERILRGASVRYRCASFMRCLSTLPSDHIVELLKKLHEYGCVNIVIVTMVRDYVRPYSYVYADQSFCISPAGGEVTVSYTLGDAKVSYTDNCFSISEWVHLSNLAGYRAEVSSQAEFMLQAYGLSPDEATYPCFTDVCLNLSAF